MNGFSAINKLKDGLASECADDLSEVFCNLEDGTCDAIELIPILEQIAEKDLFYYFDDNSSGGFPRPSGEPVSFKADSLAAIENIKENRKFGATSSIASELKSLDIQVIKSALKKIASGNSIDEKLIPILGKIAKKNNYDSYSYFTGYSKPRQFGEMALRAIQKIKQNIEEKKVKIEPEKFT